VPSVLICEEAEKMKLLHQECKEKKKRLTASMEVIKWLRNNTLSTIPVINAMRHHRLR
jgi:hypothetical protein